ncbi:pseudouridine synthase [Undibacterium macrobrachii]|uniref:Pseudouridine synthase n=1 Tax=Undibacterium macrobrachii TaxID=1119058 RepID=A0ABQ2XEE2_9BURK|nr:pseudouridine synthase [Undibacterium macrobrachii]GGX12956.1 pseudouridine synthase [Undibacterium macrobrachii]
MVVSVFFVVSYFQLFTLTVRGITPSSPAPLPTKNGISPSYIWLPEGQWESALAFLTQQFPAVSADVWRSRMAKLEVCDANGNYLHPHSPVQRGMCIFYYREIENEPTIPFQETILFEDAHLLVVDKPHFLAVIPGGQYLRETLLVRLKLQTNIEHLTPLHRLDRETAGVILFSKQIESRGAYQRLFQTRQIAKTYHALAPHLPQLTFPYLKQSRIEESDHFFKMHEVNGLANSETLINVLEHRGDIDLYELQPYTGKKHQLRLHMASLGVPILNDLFYPEALPTGSDDYTKPLKLLAKSIAFIDPLDKSKREFHSRQSL